MFRQFGLSMLRLVVILLLASFAAGALLRIAPGFSSDEQELDPGLSAQSIQAIRAARMADADIPRFYIGYLRSLLHGDLGVSLSLNQPVAQLLRQRLPVTAKNLGFALLLGWTLALAFSISAHLVRTRVLSLGSDVLSSAFISTPAAVLALIFVLLRWPPVLAAALLVFPKLYRYLRNVLQECTDMPHILAARARGASSWRVLFCHVGPLAFPQTVALLGVSLSFGLGVLLPIEVICGIAGIGQLAWQAALSRDLPLLVNLTLMVSLITVCGTMFADALRRINRGVA